MKPVDFIFVLEGLKETIAVRFSGLADCDRTELRREQARSRHNLVLVENLRRAFAEAGSGNGDVDEGLALADEVEAADRRLMERAQELDVSAPDGTMATEFSSPADLQGFFLWALLAEDELADEVANLGRRVAQLDGDFTALELDEMEWRYTDLRDGFAVDMQAARSWKAEADDALCRRALERMDAMAKQTQTGLTLVEKAKVLLAEGMLTPPVAETVH